MTDKEELRAQTRDELVEGIDARRGELERRLTEAKEGLEKAFGPREPEPRIETRGRKRANGSEFPEHARGALDTAGDA